MLATAALRVVRSQQAVIEEDGEDKEEEKNIGNEAVKVVKVVAAPPWDKVGKQARAPEAAEARRYSETPLQERDKRMQTDGSAKRGLTPDGESSGMKKIQTLTLDANNILASPDNKQSRLHISPSN